VLAEGAVRAARSFAGSVVGTPVREAAVFDAWAAAFAAALASPSSDRAEDYATLLDDAAFVVDRKARLVRDISGNPFRPVALDPAWRTPAVLVLAQAAYDNRILPAGTLDPERLAVLADALEESGCDNADILGHLRGPGPHVRGCFAVDLLLNKS
jgi:hypothetical protein